MNTLTINAAKPSLATRFAWKEYRMLRGLWLACVVGGVALQAIPTLLGIDVNRHGSQFEYFAIAWGAAAIYAVGAAIIMFAAETDDRTREFLRLLPGDWKPIFATKALMSLVTAVLLGGALSLSAWWFSGYGPTDVEWKLLLGVFGVAVLEGLAWGLLFSMWWKQPLVAAVAAIAMASLGAQIAIGLADQANVDAFSLAGYQAAVPLRLLICLAVLAVDVLVGKHWLYPRAKSAEIREAVTAKTTSGVATRTSRPRLKQFSHLLWQTWRESWRMILVAVVLSFCMMAAAMLPAFIQSTHDFLQALPFVTLFTPALLGALAFRADQQGDHRLFLTTHAAWPRYVWLARHVLWLGTVVLLGLVAHYAFAWYFHVAMREAIIALIENGWSYVEFDLFGRDYLSIETPQSVTWEFLNAEATIQQGVLTAWCAFIAAYGVGQLFSMLLKQSLLSGFLAILFSIIIAAWSILMFLWQMNPLWFVLPIGLAALLATWLRMPGWILGKNQLRHWLAPALAMVLPLVAMVMTIPSVRLAQIDDPNEGSSISSAWNAEAAIVNAEAAQTALEYERLAAQFDEQDVEFLKTDISILALMPESLQKLAEQASELTKLPHCRFPREHVLTGSHANRYLWQLQLLLANDAGRLLYLGELDTAFERLCARLRLVGHMMQNQTSGQFIVALRHETWKELSNIYAAILDWAQHEDQTSERLKSAINELQELFATLPKPEQAIHADRERIRKVILGEEPPTYQSVRLASILNQLPSEQERALAAVDVLSTQVLDYVNAVQATIANPTAYNNNKVEAIAKFRETLRSTPWSSTYAIAESIYRGNYQGFQAANKLADACASSLLVAEEFRNSGNLSVLHTWVNAETRRRALLVQLALLAYRLDHGAYPATLAELTPDYLPREINDLFSGEAFEYRPHGLEYPLVDASVVDDEDVEAGVPLLWSIGNANSQLQETFEYDAEQDALYAYGEAMPGDVDPAMADDRFGRTVLRFRPTERRGHYGHNLVFPLPK